MAKNFPDDRQPPQNLGKVPKVQIQKQEGSITVNVRGNDIQAPNAKDIGVSNFNNITDHTGHGGEGCTAVTNREYNFDNNKIVGPGSERVGIHNFNNRTLLKNSNDEDDACSSGMVE
ncbi:hypothetical protein PRUPE_1G120100 [Prunus persica]|uniref:Uncharacterized protein n=1 Tax=Prunus persica TaxID=3760 RepID=A0A251QW40_PRUPE|nr:hypothetical protein PRUPE_1G120100 [Prunus persica]